MMPKCCFKFCKNMRRSCQNDGITYFTFPGQATRRKQWTDIVRHQRGEPFFEPNSGSVVCEKHFDDVNLYSTAMGMKRLQRMAVPILDPQYKEEDDTKLTIFENPFLPNTSYPDSDDSSDSNGTIETRQKIKMESAHQDMICVDIKNETENESSSQPGTSKSSYYYSGVVATHTNCDENEKKIKIEIQELSPNITTENTKSRLGALMCIRDNPYDKFGRYVATMLKRMPLPQALELQPQIVNLITSTMSDVGDGPRTLRITKEKET